MSGLGSWFTRERIESLAALAACFAVTWLISLNLLKPNVFTADVFVHQFWMWHWRDPQLFTDSLTAELRQSARYPDGYEALFWVPTQIVSPIVFGEWLGVALMALSGWLVFAIVREHSSWRPAAWIAATLFLALFEIHRFYSGFPRAFVHPVVLLAVLLAIRRRHLAAAVVAVAGALLYPTAALLASGVLLVSSVSWSNRRPRLETPRIWFALLAVAGTVAAILGPALAAGGAPEVFSADQARKYPEFGPHGGLSFFKPSTIEYLAQNRSGFRLEGSGSVLALAALGLLLARPANLRLLRREVLALPVVALAGFAAAHALLFRLYLPHRYTYPLVAFFAIAVAVSLRPTWTALWSRPRARLRAFLLLAAPLAIFGLAIYVFPLGPKKGLDEPWTAIAVGAGALALAAAVALLLRRMPDRTVPAVAAAVTGLALVGATLGATDNWGVGAVVCRYTGASAYFASLPKDAVIAGDPIDLRCIPAAARRPVVISTQLAPAYEVDYFLRSRERMFATLRAYYGSSPAAIAELGDRYGATHLWVRPDEVRQMMATGGHWRKWNEPYGTFIQQLLRAGEPAVLRLPARCRTWQNESSRVYDIHCLAAKPVLPRLLPAEYVASRTVRSGDQSFLPAQWVSSREGRASWRSSRGGRGPRGEEALPVEVRSRRKPPDLH